MSPVFQSTLVGNNARAETKISLLDKFLELNVAMYKFNARITASHPYSSKWYQWPFNKRSIWYWTKNVNNEKANIYLLGNPFVWWPIFFLVLFTAFRLIQKSFRQRTPKVIYFFFFGYLINLLPFLFIKRVTFLYHYLPSLIFGILISIIVLEKIFTARNRPGLKKSKEFLGFPSKARFSLYFGYLFLILASFIFLAPLSYGFPVSQKLFFFYQIILKILS